jgi:hypothetical protein
MEAYESGIIFTAMGAVITVVVMSRVMNAHRRKNHWPKAYGKILASEIVVSTYRVPGSWTDSKSYKAIVRYEYKIHDFKYRSDLVSFGFHLSTQRLAEKRIQEYPKGRDVMVYYDPDHFSMSCLKPGLGSWDWIVSVAGVGMLGGGIVLLTAAGLLVSASGSELEICNFAITTDEGTAMWESRPTYLEYVNEAKRRDLTPEQCAEILGR